MQIREIVHVAVDQTFEAVREPVIGPERGDADGSHRQDAGDPYEEAGKAGRHDGADENLLTDREGQPASNGDEAIELKRRSRAEQSCA